MGLIEILESIGRGQFQEGTTAESSEGVKVSRNGLNFFVFDFWGNKEVWLFDPPTAVFTQPLVDHAY
jgi:hypothetical protein